MVYTWFYEFNKPGIDLGREVQEDFHENITFKLISTGCLEEQTIPGREKCVQIF